MEPFNLRRLRTLRADRRGPELPVFIVANRQDEDRMAALGALAINCRSGDHDADWSPIAGLDVILMLPEREVFTPLVKTLRSARPRRLRQYIHGYGFDTVWDPQ